MGKRYTPYDKPAIQKALHEYIKRRIDYKQRGISTEKITFAISRKRKSLKLLEEKEMKVRKLADQIEEFINFNLWQSSARTENIAILAKGLFCKYGIEHGLKGLSLGWFLGTPHSFRASQIRLNFQRSFEKNPKHKQVWLNFKSWIKLQNNVKDTEEIPLLNTGLPDRDKSE